MSALQQATHNERHPADVDASALTPELFKQTLERYGTILVRQLFDAKEAEVLAGEVQDLFYVIENLSHNGLMTENGIRYLQGGHPASLLPNMRLLQNMLNKKAFIESFQRYFGAEQLEVNVESTGVRRCDPGKWKNFLPWHQDILHRGETFATIWLPLCSVGGDSPGLEVLPVRIMEKQHTDSGVEVTYGKGMDDKEVTAKFGSDRLHPVMELGDVLVFEPRTLHRTYQTPGMTRERVSLDVRIHPSQSNPEADHWKTKILSFPTKETVLPQLGKNGRTSFNLQHLVAAAAPGAAPAAAAPAAGNAPSGVKSKLRRKLRAVYHGLKA